MLAILSEDLQTITTQNYFTMKKNFLTLSFVLFIIPIGISQDLPSNIPTNGLIAYYPFNGNANDESGNSNNGNVLGASLSGDRFGNENSAYSFDGIDDFIVTQNSIASAKQVYTFSFWAKTENGTKNMSAISQNCNDDCDKAYSLVINKFLNSAVECEDGHMGSSPQSFGYAQPAHYGTVNTITSGNVWKNYVLIVGAEDNFLYNNFKFYVNGTQIDTNCNHNWDSWEYDFPNYPMVIGKGNNSIIEGFFDGQLDDVAVWDRALSLNEIKELYDLPPGILLNGIISAENNQIKNVGFPTDDNDAATKNYVDSNINSFSGSYNDLTDKPTTYTQSQVDALIEVLQNQINDLKQGTVTAEISFGQIYDLETGEICDEPEPMFCDSRFDLRFPYGGGDIKARLWWNESDVDVAYVYDKSFFEIQLSDVSSYYFCEHINDPNQACSNTDSPPTNFIGIYHTSEGNYYAVEYINENLESFKVSFRYKLLQ